MKQMGIISNDYEALYEKWKNTTHCEECNVELVGGNLGRNRKCIDHDHSTGLFRNIICHRCNFERGIVDNNIVAMTEEQQKEKRRAYYQANAERIKTERMQRYYQTHP